MIEEVTQSKARFEALDTLTVVMHEVRMPVGFGRFKTKGRPLSKIVHLEKSIIEIRAETN